MYVVCVPNIFFVVLSLFVVLTLEEPPEIMPLKMDTCQIGLDIVESNFYLVRRISDYF